MIFPVCSRAPHFSHILQMLKAVRMLLWRQWHADVRSWRQMLETFRRLSRMGRPASSCVEEMIQRLLNEWQRSSLTEICVSKWVMLVGPKRSGNLAWAVLLRKQSLPIAKRAGETSSCVELQDNSR